MIVGQFLKPPQLEVELRTSLVNAEAEALILKQEPEIWSNKSSLGVVERILKR